MSDKDKLEMLLSHQAPCIKTLGGRAIKFQSEPPILEMEFEAVPEFCHSDNQVVQGCLLYTSPSPRDLSTSRMPSSA